MITIGLALYGALALVAIVGLGKAAGRPLPEFKAERREEESKHACV